jgi:hypothetical protein
MGRKRTHKTESAEDNWHHYRNGVMRPGFKNFLWFIVLCIGGLVIAGIVVSISHLASK